jgi:hypothetical protein
MQMLEHDARASRCSSIVLVDRQFVQPSQG